MRLGSRRGLLRWIGWLVACALVVWAMEPPPALPIDAPKDRFSADRAQGWVEKLARSPRVPGTDAHRAARESIFDALRGLGMQPEVRTRLVFREGKDHMRAAWVHNIHAERPGTGAPVVLSAHYDSVPTGPGAADDASGVAVVLEALRAAIDSGKRLPPIDVLITDAEEYGLLGAKAAVEDGSLPKSAVVLNFEARGGGGTVFLFETSDRNAPLAELLSVLPRPVTSSVMVSVYKRLPNDTDLTLFREAGLAGLNFAFVGRWSAYHTALDTPRNLDRRSVQQAGDSAVALLGKLGEPGRSDLAASRAGGESGWTDLLGRWVVSWPVAGSQVAVGLAGLLWALAAVSSVRQKRGVGALLAGFVAGGGWIAAAYGMGWVAKVYCPEIGLDRPWGDPYGIRWFSAAALVVLSGFGMMLASALARSGPASAWGTGALLPGLLAAIAAAIWMPGAAHLFAVPIAMSSFALLTPKPAPALELFVGVVWPVLLVPTIHGLWLLFGWPGLPIVVAASAFLMLPLAAGLRSQETGNSAAIASAFGLAIACATTGWWIDHRDNGDQPAVSTAFEWRESGEREGTRFVRMAGERPNSVAGKPEELPIPWAKGFYRVTKRPADAVPGIDMRPEGRGVRLIPEAGMTECLIWSRGRCRGASLDGTAVPLVEGRLALRLFGARAEGWLLESTDGELPVLDVVSVSPTGRALEPGTIAAPVWPYPGHRMVHDSWPRTLEAGR